MGITVLPEGSLERLIKIKDVKLQHFVAMETWEIISSFHSVFGAYYVPGTALSLKQSGQNSGRFLTLLEITLQ